MCVFCCTVEHRGAVCCNVLQQGAAGKCFKDHLVISVLQRVAVCAAKAMQRCVATGCCGQVPQNSPHHIVCCIVVQCGATAICVLGKRTSQKVCSENVPHKKTLQQLYKWRPFVKCVAVWYSVLQIAPALCPRNVPHKWSRHIVCCSVLQRVAVWCSVLQCGAACCSGVQRVAVWCSMLQCATFVCFGNVPHKKTLLI